MKSKEEFHVIVHNQSQKVLLVRSRNPLGEYRYPCGIVEPGEDFPQAVNRVMDEQIGRQILDPYPKQFAVLRHGEAGTAVIGVMATPGDKHQRSTRANELPDAGWFSREDVLANPLVEKELKDDALAGPLSLRLATRRYTVD